MPNTRRALGILLLKLGVDRPASGDYYGHMTYFENETDRQEDLHARFDAEFPGWEEREIDPEDRILVPENDVLNPHEGVVKGYGGDQRRYFPGVDGE